MHRHLQGALWVLTAALAGLHGPEAAADSELYVGPSLAVGRVYESNIFASATDRQSDSLWRVSPAIDAGYQSDRFTLAGYGTVDAERYGEHPNLDANAVRRYETLLMRYKATPRLGLDLHADYTTTETPAQLTPATELLLGRVHARVLSVSPSVTYAFSPLTTGSATYINTQYLLAGSPDTDIGTAALDLTRQVDERDALKFDFASSRYDFGAGSVVNSRVLSVGWDHKLSGTTDLLLAAGPRNTNGDVVPDISVNLSHDMEGGNLQLSYARSQEAVIGQAGIVDTRSFSAGLRYTLSPYLQVQFAPSYVSERSGGGDARLYRLTAGAEYKFDSSVSLLASYQYNFQRGLLTGGPDQKILDNVIYVGLVFSFRSSISGAFEKRRNSPYELLWPSRTEESSKPRQPSSPK